AVVTRWSLGTGAGNRNAASRASWVRSTARVGRSAHALARYAREHGIDVVHVDGTPSCGGVGLAVARFAGVPLLVHFHELLGRYPGGRDHSPARRVVERTVARRAQRLVAVSEFIADEIRAARVARRPIDVVPTGVDIRRV